MRHSECTVESAVGDSSPRLGHPPQQAMFTSHEPELQMTWTKPAAEVVAVTMEVTAYVATL